MNMPVNCVAPWAGGKRSMAKRIISELGGRERYYEPFVGGCAILPQLTRRKAECINDANPKIVDVLRCLRDHADELIRTLGQYQFERDVFDRAKHQLENEVSEGPLQAANQLVAWWMGANGFAGTTKPGWFAQRHPNKLTGKLTGGCPAKRWESFKESIPALGERLQGVHIYSEEFSTFINEHVPDCDDACMYVDSPYIRKSFRYEYDFSDADHKALAGILNEYKRTIIVVSYVHFPDIDVLYPPSSWRKIEVKKNKAMGNATGKVASQSVELLLVNDADS